MPNQELMCLGYDADPPHAWSREECRGRRPARCPEHHEIYNKAKIAAWARKNRVVKQASGEAYGYNLNYNPRPRTITEILAPTEAVLEEYRAHLPLTVRQIFYRLVGSIDYPKTEDAYTRLGGRLAEARRGCWGTITFDAIRDDGLSQEGSGWGYDDPDHFFEANKLDAAQYFVSHQRGQAQFIELWCEAAGMVPQLAQATHEFSIPVYSGGGQNSVTVKHAAAERVRDRDVPTVILHVGDYDPDGEVIYRSLAGDVKGFCERDGGSVDCRRVALTHEQVDAYSLPESPPKDSKALVRWKEEGKGKTSQLEALLPGDLATIVRTAVKDLIDADVLAEQLKQEQEDRETISKRIGDA